MSSSLQQHLSKLEVEGPVQQYAIAAVFDVACAGSSAPPSAAAEDAIRQCLSLPTAQPVGVAVTKLLEAVKARKLDDQTAQLLLLTALSVSTPAAAVPLANGCFSLFAAQLTVPSPAATRQQHQGAPWKAHFLSKAMLASQSAGPALIAGTCRLITATAGGSSVSQPAVLAALAALRPFFGFVLLDPDASEARPQLAAALHGGLARAAAALWDAPQAQHAVLRLLVDFLPALQVRAPLQQAAAACFVGDVMDLLEGCLEDPDAALVETLAVGLLSLCADVARLGGGPRPFLAALSSLALHWPEAVLPAVPELAALAANAAGEDSTAALALAHRLLREFSSEASGSPLPLPLAAWVAVQLVPMLAFAQDRAIKQWAAAVLARLQNPLEQKGSGASNLSPTTTKGGAGTPAQVRYDLLCVLWDDATAAQRWLSSLGAELASSSTASLRDAPAAFPLVLSLLHHPNGGVSAAALETMLSVLRVAPLLGVQALPVVIHRLGRLVENFRTHSDSKPLQQTNTDLLLATMYALPRLASHPSSTPFIVRALQPLLAPPAPQLLQAVALRMLCEMWTATGRGYPHLRTAMLSYAAGHGVDTDSIGRAPTPQEPSLRLAWAATLADICAGDAGGSRAAELVHCIADCLRDGTTPAVQAAGLHAVAALCESDVLDFYKAWKVVHTSIPTLPESPAAAAGWVHLLASGFLDAVRYPEVARGIVGALWVAARHPHAAVRAQAAASLAVYDLAQLEEIEALPPHWQYASLLRDEPRPQTAAQLEGLLAVVLRHEHATRRRPQQPGGAGKSRAAGLTAGGAAYKLAVALPKALLGPAATFLQRLPDLSPAAVLYLWAPLPPAALLSTPAGKRTAAKHAFDAYAAVFSVVCDRFAASCDAPPLNRASAKAAAWGPFLKRWCAASKDAVDPKDAASAAERVGTGLSVVWSRVRELLDIQNAAAGSKVSGAVGAAWAAAALATASAAQPGKRLVREVHAALAQHAQNGAQSAGAVQAAACAALGHIADTVRVSEGLPAAMHAVHALQDVLTAPAAPAVVRAGAAEGLGLACRRMARSAAGNAEVAVLVRDALETLCGAVVPHLNGSHGPAIEAALWDPSSPHLEIFSTPAEVGEAALGGAADAVHAAVALGLARDLVPALRAAVAGEILETRGGATPPSACALLHAATLAGFKSNVVSAVEVGETLRLLVGVCRRAGSADEQESLPHGKLVGAAAAALGELVTGLSSEGYVFEDPSRDACLEAAMATAAGALRLRSSQHARQGAAVGLAAFLAAGFGTVADPELSGLERNALDTLESLALVKNSSAGARPAPGCAAALAALCWIARHPDRAPEHANEPKTTDFNVVLQQAAAALAEDGPAARTLSTLPEDGALRYLCETAAAGAWPAIEDDGEEGNERPPPTKSSLLNRKEEDCVAIPLTAEHAAAVLRCLTAAPRLPALDWCAACRRLLRSHPGSKAVQQGCISLAAAHASLSPASRLGDLVAADLLAPRQLEAWHPEAQAAALAALPLLLRALPDAEAAATLRLLCDAYPSAEESDCSEGAAAWQAALLEGLASVAERSSGGSYLSTEAAGLAINTVLPKLPSPSPWPLDLRLPSSPTGVTIERLEGQKKGFEGQRWRALLRCALALPSDAIEAAVGDATRFQQLPLHWTWLMAGLAANGGSDLRGLQLPRNLVLNGRKRENKEEESAIIMLTARALIAPRVITPAQQHQWLADLLHAAERCANPAGAVKLAACAAVAVACSRSSSALSADLSTAAAHVALATSRNALLALPACLAVLGGGGGAGAAPGELLCSLVRAVGLVQEEEGVEGPALQRRCCLALRHVLPAALWAELWREVDGGI